MKKHLFVAVISALIGAIIYGFLYYAEIQAAPSMLPVLSGLFLATLPAIGAGWCVVLVNAWLDKRVSWKSAYAWRFAFGFVLSTVVAGVVAMGLATLYFEVKHGLGLAQLAEAQGDNAAKLLVLLIVFSFIFSVVYGAIYAYHEFAHAQVGRVMAGRKQLELQFEALKSQISPHYLFNSLNTISSLVYKDARLAEDFIRRLAQTYHYILATKDRPWVLLKEEIEFVKSYYYLLQVRFEDSLRLEINLPPNVMETRIPPLTLQMLVENAVKHNQITREQPLYVYISVIDNTLLKVINSKNTPHTMPESFRIGLDNIRQRYRYFTPKEVVVKNDDQFTVHLPVIKQEPMASMSRHIA
jgi:two-component system, LytTR family, sensor kinase